jgi:quinol monooxygenase YgiN
MILSTVRLAISPEHRPEALRIMRVFMGHATAQAGCAGFWLSQDLTNPQGLTISNQWVTRDDFYEHVRSTDYRLLLAVIDLSMTPPEIRFDDVEHLGGLELVEALRAPRHAIRENGRS